MLRLRIPVCVAALCLLLLPAPSHADAPAPDAPDIATVIPTEPDADDVTLYPAEILPERASDAGKVPAKTDATSGPPPAIAVADFTGADRQMGRFLADTLLTDLAQSDRLRLIERGEISKALEELRLQASGILETDQVKRFGSLVRADQIVIGSYLEHDGQVIINARLLDVQTGALLPGGAANVSGEQHDLLWLVHRLSHLLHRRITKSDFVMDGEGARPAAAAADESDGSQSMASAGDHKSIPTTAPQATDPHAAAQPSTDPSDALSAALNGFQQISANADQPLGMQDSTDQPYPPGSLPYFSGFAYYNYGPPFLPYSTPFPPLGFVSGSIYGRAYIQRPHYFGPPRYNPPRAPFPPPPPPRTGPGPGGGPHNGGPGQP